MVRHFTSINRPNSAESPALQNGKFKQFYIANYPYIYISNFRVKHVDILEDMNPLCYIDQFMLFCFNEKTFLVAKLQAN